MYVIFRQDSCSFTVIKDENSYIFETITLYVILIYMSPALRTTFVELERLNDSDIFY